MCIYVRQAVGTNTQTYTRVTSAGLYNDIPIHVTVVMN